MRWLVIHPGPQFSVADVYTGWVEALRSLGEHVIEFNLDRRLQFFDSAMLETGLYDDEGRPSFRKAVERDEAVVMAAEGVMSMCYRVWPDVVLGVSAFFTPPAMLDIMRSRRHKVVLLHTESPYQDEEQIVRAASADLNLLNDPVNIERYREVGPAYYMPHAYRPSIHHPGPPVAILQSDFAFVGTGFKSRIEFFEAMDLEGVDTLLAGPWPDLAEDSKLRDYVLTEEMCDNNDQDSSVACLDNNHTADVYRSTKVGINVYRQESEKAHKGEGWAMGPREVEMAATGLFFLRDSRPESDGVFGGILPAFYGPEDASEKLRWWLRNEKLRAHRAEQAREATAARTFENNAKQLLKLLDKI